MGSIPDPKRLKYPIVLVHGLGARGTYGPIDYFHGIPQHLRESDNDVFVARMTAWQTLEHRGEQLRDQILARFPDEKVNLIGHSMGGLDARYLVSKLGFAERVASVTTVGTPNRGTMVGDLAMELMPAPAFLGIERVMSLLKSSPRGLHQLSSKYISETLAPQLVDAPGVGYFSATSAIAEPAMKNSLPLFWIPHRVLKSYEDENDGFVSVQSAIWGNHICTYVGDHYAQIGQFLGRYRGLDHLKFFDEIVARLKREGF